MQLLSFFFNYINRLHRNRYFLIGLCCDSHSFKFLLGTTVTPREIEDNGDAKIWGNFGWFSEILAFEATLKFEYKKIQVCLFVYHGRCKNVE